VSRSASYPGVFSMEYELIYSTRKTIAIQIMEDGRVVVRAPKKAGKRAIERFLSEKDNWIRTKQQEILEAYENKKSGLLTEAQKLKMKGLAKEVFAAKTAHFARIMGVTYGRITIREQKTRWGSCSLAGNLNFNWKLLLAPDEVVDYVVIHELAHRREMNHSSRFYAVVAEIMPDYKVWQRWLKVNGKRL